MKKIAILGFGVVGSGAAQIIEENGKILERRLGEPIEIKYILDRRELSVPCGARLVHDAQVIFDDPEISLVAEMLGGSHPAYEFTRSALLAGKHVVTSNKEVVANYGAELLSLANEMGVRYLFEASVGGGIPIIRPLQNDLVSNNVTEIRGILNGTTNYILTLMDESGAELSSALADAQAHGYAEADPTADVEGLDAARKICILSAIGFGRCPSADLILRRGIMGVRAEHIAAARELGYKIKLIARAKMHGGKLCASVAPTLVPLSDPLAHVSGVYNGILVGTDMLGPVFFSGQGAGKLPTASAVVADITDALENGFRPTPSPLGWASANADEVASEGEMFGRYCIFVGGRLEGLRYFDGADVSVMITPEMCYAECEQILHSLPDGAVAYPML